MTTIGTYNIDNVLKNDTYNGFKATVTVNSTPLDLTGYCLKMFLRQRSKTGAVKKTFSSSDGIIITDAVNGVFQVSPFIVNLNADTYYYDIEFVSPTGTVKTYLQGTFKVIQDVTNGGICS